MLDTQHSMLLMSKMPTSTTVLINNKSHISVITLVVALSHSQHRTYLPTLPRNRPHDNLSARERGGGSQSRNRVGHCRAKDNSVRIRVALSRPRGRNPVSTIDATTEITGMRGSTSARLSIACSAEPVMTKNVSRKSQQRRGEGMGRNIGVGFGDKLMLYWSSRRHSYCAPPDEPCICTIYVVSSVTRVPPFPFELCENQLSSYCTIRLTNTQN